MSRNARTLRALIADALRTADCRDARRAWAGRTSAAWLAAHRELDEFLTQAVSRLSEEEFERLCEAEFAKVDAIMAQLSDAIDDDKWPRELYLGRV